MDDTTSGDGDGGAAAPPPLPPPRRRRGPPSRQVSNIDLPKKHAGILGTSANLVNSIVGAGIIGIPYAIRESGLIAGTLILILVAYLTDKSLRTLINLACFHPSLHGRGVLTYEDLLTIPYGKTGRIFILVNMLILAYGAMVAYLLIIKDTIPTILGLTDAGRGSFVERELIMLITSLLIMLPLSMLRDIASLSFTSALSVTADIILVIFVIIYSPIKTSVSEAGGFGEVLKQNWINGRLFIGLGVISTAMACQHSSFIVSGSLSNKTSARWGAVTCRSITSAAILTTTMGIFGYLGFLDQTQGDILNNFSSSSIMANAGRMLLAITMFFTYPMEAFVARHVLAQLLYNGNLDNTTINTETGETVAESKWCYCIGRREILTLGIYVATLIPGMIFADLGPVLALTGAVGASCVAYIGPGIGYLGLFGADFLEYVHGALESRSKKKGGAGAGGDIELPVVGDATAVMESPPEVTGSEGHHESGSESTTTTATNSRSQIGSLAKPWWYYLCFYPLWVALASSGAHGTKQFFDNLEAQDETANLEPEQEQDDDKRHADDSDEIIGPRRRDYFMSMFFVLFGALALVVGVTTIIYVQVKGIVYRGP